MDRLKSIFFLNDNNSDDSGQIRPQILQRFLNSIISRNALTEIKRYEKIYFFNEKKADEQMASATLAIDKKIGTIFKDLSKTEKVTVAMRFISPVHPDNFTEGQIKNSACQAVRNIISAIKILDKRKNNSSGNSGTLDEFSELTIVLDALEKDLDQQKECDYNCAKEGKFNDLTYKEKYLVVCTDRPINTFSSSSEQIRKNAFEKIVTVIQDKESEFLYFNSLPKGLANSLYGLRKIKSKKYKVLLKIKIPFIYFNLTANFWKLSIKPENIYWYQTFQWNDHELYLNKNVKLVKNSNFILNDNVKTIKLCDEHCKIMQELISVQNEMQIFKADMDNSIKEVDQIKNVFEIQSINIKAIQEKMEPFKAAIENSTKKANEIENSIEIQNDNFQKESKKKDNRINQCVHINNLSGQEEIKKINAQQYQAVRQIRELKNIIYSDRICLGFIILAITLSTALAYSAEQIMHQEEIALPFIGLGAIIFIASFIYSIFYWTKSRKYNTDASLVANFDGRDVENQSNKFKHECSMKSIN